MKHFVWRAFREYLPTYGSLHRRHVDCIPYCPCYNALPEYVMHAIYGCKASKKIWKAYCFACIFDTGIVRSFCDWCFQMMEYKQGVDLDFFCTLAWATWNERNLMIAGEVAKRPEMVVEDNHKYLTIFQRLNVAHNTRPARTPPKKSSWTKPNRGELKLHVDAVVCQISGRAGIGG